MDFRETAVEYVSCDDYATFYSSEIKWIRKIRSLQSSNPDAITIVNDSEDSIIAHIPKSWLKISPPKKMSLTDEQRKAAKERLAEARKKKGCV